MKVKEFETKYSPEDFVWFMHDNKPTQAMITRVNVEIEESADIHGGEIPNILAKLKSFLHLHKKKFNIKYTIDEIQNGKFYSAHGGWYPESDLFPTKEALLKSL